MRATSVEQRPTGIAGAGELPWGGHFGVFYVSQQELLEVLVPFIKTGLQNNELCSWEMEPPLTVAIAKQALAEAMPNLAEYVARGQIELIAPRPAPPASPSPPAESLDRRLDGAILAGFDGLRLVRPAAPGKPGSAPAVLGLGVGQRNIIAAFVYSRAGLAAADLMEVVQDHRFALVCSSGRWEVLAGSEARIARDALARSEVKLRSLFANMSEGFAFHRIVLDGQGRPCDYIFLEINPAFEHLTGLDARRAIGKRVTEILPGIDKDPTDWIGKYGRVALTGEPMQFESHAAPLGKWYAVSAFSPHKGYFAVTFADITDRKKAEAQRQEAEGRLLITLRSIGDAVVSTDTGGRVLMLNRVAEELTGYTQAEAAGRPLREVFNIINESSGEPAEDPVRKVIETGMIVGLANHTALVRRDGTRLSIADSAAPVRSEAGELLGVVLVFRDVTEERRAETALARSEEKYRNLFMNMTEEVHFWRLVRDQHGAIKTWRLVDANPPTLRTWGKRLDEIKGKTTDEIFGPGATEHYLPIVQKIMAEGVAHSYEDYFPNLDKYFRFTSIPLGSEHFITTGADISGIRRAMRLYEVLSRVNESIVRTHDEPSLFDQICQIVAEAAGYPLAWIGLLRGREIVPVASSGTASDYLQEIRVEVDGELGGGPTGTAVREDRVVVNHDFAANPATAPWRPPALEHGFRASAAIPLHREGKPIGALTLYASRPHAFDAEQLRLLEALCADVSYALDTITQERLRVEAEAELREANLQLADADRRKNEFLAVLSHELRNPLGPIANSLYILDHAPLDGDQAKRAKQILGRQVTQLSNLVNDLLDVTRIARNKVQLQKQRLALDEVVRRTVEDNRSHFERAGVQLELVEAPCPVMVVADGTRVAQVVSNLLQNAAKFTATGGCTRVSVSSEDGQAVLRVRDNGVGISSDNLARLFQPFMQAEHTLDRSKGGLGLGLALVKGLVELHGGTVSAHSDGLGKGTEFVVRFPLASDAPLRAESTHTRAVAARRRVLIIEDNIDAADSLRAALELGDHEIEVAYNGRDGLAKARVFGPEVVLCDIGLPGMDGFDVARAFRADEALQHTFLVALTGYALPEDVQRAQEAGFDRHLAKPPSIEKLQELLGVVPALPGPGSARARIEQVPP